MARRQPSCSELPEGVRTCARAPPPLSDCRVPTTGVVPGDPLKRQAARRTGWMRRNPPTRRPRSAQRRVEHLDRRSKVKGP